MPTFLAENAFNGKWRMHKH